MKVTIEQVNKHMLKVNGKAIGEFSLIEQWEGMAKYISKDGILIVSHRTSFEKIFDDLLGDIDLDVIKASPEILSRIKEATE